MNISNYLQVVMYKILFNCCIWKENKI